MINTSEDYQKVVSGIVIPRCKPTITATYFSNNQKQTVSWTSSEIKSISYSREIDPTGIDMPYMELSWTEFTASRIFSDVVPDKYSGLKRGDMVIISWTQDIGKNKNTWANVFKKYTWAALKKSTWADVRKYTAAETIDFYPLFLTDTPKVKNGEITWTAKDVLYFLDDKILVQQSASETKLGSVIANILYNKRSDFDKETGLYKVLTSTAKWFASADSEKIWKAQGHNYAENISMNAYFKNLLAVFCRYICFCGAKNNLEAGHFEVKPLGSYNTTSISVGLSNIFSGQTTKKGSDLKQYSETKYDKNVAEGEYQKQTSYTITEGNGGYYYTFDLDKYASNANEDYLIEHNNEVLLGVSSVCNGKQIKAWTKNQIATGLTAEYRNLTSEKAKTIISDYNTTGENISENNDLCTVLTIADESLPNRGDLLNSYYSKSKDYIEWEMPANLAIEPGDIISVEKDQYTADGKTIKTNVLVLKIGLEYNGVLTESIKAKEV